MGPNFETFRNLQHYDEYYLPGGDLYCIVEDKLFRVHRYFFERESTFFKSKLGTPATPGVSRIGTAEDSAVLLDNVSTKDFAKLLWVFYNPKYSLYDAGVEDWSTILRLADRWVFAEVKNLAVRELEKKEMPDIDRIVLYHQFKVDEEHLLPRYAALCERPELLTVDEGLKLGMEIVIPLSRARECARNLASTSGSSSPSPAGLDGNELTNIIKDHFGIKPTKSPAETSSGQSNDSGTGAGDKTPGGDGSKSNTNGSGKSNANGANTNGNNRRKGNSPGGGGT